MSEYDNGFRRGQNETNYSGSGSHADWAGWQQGNAQRQQNEAQLQQKMMEGTAAKAPNYAPLQGGSGGGGLSLIIIGLFVLVPLIFYTLMVGLWAALAAGVSMPLFFLWARGRGAKLEKSFRRHYFTMLAALAGYGAAIVAIFVLLHFTGDVRDPFMTFHFLTWRGVVNAFIALQIPALSAFAAVQLIYGELFPRSFRGFFEAAFFGLGAAIVGGGCASLVLYFGYRIL